MLVLGLLIAMTSGKNASENEATVEAEPIVTDELENNNKMCQVKGMIFLLSLFLTSHLGFKT